MRTIGGVDHSSGKGIIFVLERNAILNPGSLDQDLGGRLLDVDHNGVHSALQIIDCI